MAGNLVKEVMLKIVGQNTDAQAKLDQITARADELKRDNPTITPKVDSAAASARLAVLRKELKDTGSQSTDTKTKLSGLRGVLSDLTFGLPSGIGEMSLLQKVMAGVSVATGVGEPLIAGLTVTVMGLASGLVAGAAGLGVFGLVAKSAFSTASTAATSAASAQTTYQNAVAKAGLTYQQSMASATTAAQRQSAATTQSNAVQQAALTRTQALNAAYSGMSASQIQLSKTITTVEGAWNSFVASNTSGVSRILSQGLGLLPQIFSMLQPFLGPTEKALSGLISDLSRAVAPAQQMSHAAEEAAAHMGGLVKPAQQGSVRSFFQLLSQNAGPAITKIGIALGHIGTGITGVLTAFMPFAQRMLSGLDELTAKFSKWGQTLTSHSGFQSLIAMFKTDTPFVIGILKSLAGILHTVADQMTSMNTVGNSRSLLQALGPILQFVNALLKAHPGLVNLILYMKLASDAGGKLKTAFTGLSSSFEGIQKGVKAVSNLRKGLTDADDAADTATGAWGTFGGKLSSAGSGIAKVGKSGKQALSDFRAGFSDSNAAASAFTGIWGTAGGKISSAGSAIKTAVAGIKDWGIWSKIASGATKIWTGVQAVFNAVMALNPITLIIIAIVALVAVIVILTIKFAWMRDFWKAAWRDIKAAGVDAWHAIDTAFHAIASAVTSYLSIVRSVVSSVFGWIRDYIDTEVGIIRSVLGWFGQLPGLFRGWWNSAENAVTSVVGSMISFVKSIPSRILSALGNLGSLLYDAGRNAISGLISGIESKIGAISSPMSSVASEIRSFLPFSPAKQGPLSGAGSPDRAGLKIASMVAGGITSGTPGAQQAMRRLAASLGAPGGSPLALAGGGGGSGPVQVIIDFTGLPAEFEAWFKGRTRSRGGRGKNSVQIAWGLNH